MDSKILFTASTYSHIRNFHLPYLRHYQEKGWTVHVACGNAPNCIPEAAEVIDLPFEKKMSSRENFRAARILRERIAEEGYSLITTHTSLAAFFTRLALPRNKKKRPPVANMVHGYLFDDETGFFKRQLLLTAERWMAPRTDLLLTMNRWDYATARRHRLGRRVVNVPGIGVDFSRLSTADPVQRQAMRREVGIPKDGFVLFYAAEFSKRKNQSMLIRAMEKLPKNVILVLAGEGELYPQCRKLAVDLGVKRRVIFPGYVQHVGKWYAMADAAVSASRSEGLPFNIMEAMYAGLPVIASAVKGHEDLISEGETGLLYPYGDESAFVDQVIYLLGSPALRKKLADQAAANVLQYGLEQVFPIVLEQYETLLKRDRVAVSAAAFDGKA